MIPSSARGGRNAGLDGLRGIAALSVALGHCVLHVTGLGIWGLRLRDFPAVPAADAGMRLLSAVFPSDAAVMVFFVLSGHVLWQSFERKQLRLFRDLPEYACARVYRLFPLVIVSGMLLAQITSASAAELVNNMLLLSKSLNGVLWSLQVEVVASLALFALWGVTRGSGWKLLLGFVLSLVAAQYSRGNFSVYFFPAFVMGALVGSMPPRLLRQPWLIAIGTVVLVFTSVILGHNGITRFIEMAGATILVGAVANGELQWLHTRVPLFLGAISYPFYLTHIVGLWGSDWILNPLPPIPPLLMIAARAVVSIGLTIPLAWLLHVFVEDPVQRVRPRITWPSWQRTSTSRQALNAKLPAASQGPPR